MPSAKMPALAVFWAAAPDTKAGTKCKTAKRALKPASVLRIRFGFTAMQVPVRAYAPRGTGRAPRRAGGPPPPGAGAPPAPGRRPVPRGETLAGLAKEAGVFRRIATGLPPASMGGKYAFVNGAFARQNKRISKIPFITLFLALIGFMALRRFL